MAGSGCRATSTIGTSRSADNHAERGRRGVGQHVAEDQVQIGRLQSRQQARRPTRRRRPCRNRSPRRRGTRPSRRTSASLPQQFVQQPVELGPVGVEADAEHADRAAMRVCGAKRMNSSIRLMIDLSSGPRSKPVAFGHTRLNSAPLLHHSHVRGPCHTVPESVVGLGRGKQVAGQPIRPAAWERS